MPGYSNGPRRWRGLAVLIALLALAAGCAQRTEETLEPGREAAVPSSDSGPQASSRAYVNPNTGRLEPSAQPGEGTDPLAVAPERLSRFQEDLVEEPLEEGGYKVDLRGRFRSETVARIDENGELTIDCITDSSGDAEGEAEVPMGDRP